MIRMASAQLALWIGAMLQASVATAQDASRGLLWPCEGCSPLAYVPAGTLKLGGQGSVYAGRALPIDVSISPFFLGIFEVSVAEYNLCVRESSCPPLSPDTGQAEEDLENLPVSNVRHLEAASYLAWLSAKTGEVYRLPTNSEWEYAARAGTDTKYWWGDTPSRSMMNFGSEDVLLSPDASDGWLLASPVGSFPPNPWGFHDMNGNVQELVEDCATERRRALVNERDLLAFVPLDGSAAGSWSDRDCSVLQARGGSYLMPSFSAWNDLPAEADIPIGKPEFLVAEGIGFRVARSIGAFGGE
jgi:formylglycine-generating enzyme required for sulfatase activity